MFLKVPSLNNFANKLQRRYSSFRSNEYGSVAVTFGLALIPVFLSVGFAVDYTRIAHTKGVIDEALDAAVLMSGHALSEGKQVDAKFRQNFEEFFFANVNGRTHLAKDVKIQTFSADPVSGKVSATAKSDINTAFMGIIGLNTVDVNSQSEATISSKKFELSMMLDVTGSMRNQDKLSALKNAAKNAIDILLPATSSNNKMRIGLVPYSESVNVGRTVAKKVSADWRRTSCVTERYSNRFNDVSYSTSKVEGKNSDCPSQKVVPLSSNPGTLKSSIDGYRASGYTAGHLGVAWSYYTLSPNWAGAWTSSGTPASYSDTNVQKVALLMTDGEFNTIYTKGWNSSNYAVNLCDDMKKKNIVIYAVGFKAPKAAEATLRSCATSDTSSTTYYYSADSADDLDAAFKNIANDIKNLRLSK